MSTEDGAGRLRAALEQFDAANGKDPRSVVVAGREFPQELLYGRRMSRRLASYEAGASEELQLAVRSQHLCRWRLPRSSFPAGRPGYLSWRRACAAMHAELSSEILAELGYERSTIERVASLLQKQGLRSGDLEAQVLEDVACLVFLADYAEDFAAGRKEDQVGRILRRTWQKMSQRAQETASKELAEEPIGSLIRETMAMTGSDSKSSARPEVQK